MAISRTAGLVFNRETISRGILAVSTYTYWVNLNRIWNESHSSTPLIRLLLKRMSWTVMNLQWFDKQEKKYHFFLTVWSLWNNTTTSIFWHGMLGANSSPDCLADVCDGGFGSKHFTLLRNLDRYFSFYLGCSPPKQSLQCLCICEPTVSVCKCEYNNRPHVCVLTSLGLFLSYCSTLTLLLKSLNNELKGKRKDLLFLIYQSHYFI